MMALLAHDDDRAPRTAGSDVAIVGGCVLLRTQPDSNPHLPAVDQFTVHSADIVDMSIMCAWYMAASGGDSETWFNIVDQDPPARENGEVGVIYVFVLLQTPGTSECIMQSRVIAVHSREAEYYAGVTYDPDWARRLALTVKVNARTYRDESGLIVVRRPIQQLSIDWLQRELEVLG